MLVPRQTKEVTDQWTVHCRWTIN